MTDIVERLRAFRPVYGWPEEYATVETVPMNEEAAAEIERLRAANAVLRERESGAIRERNDAEARVAIQLTRINELEARLAEAVEVMRDVEVLLSSSFAASIIDSADERVLGRARAFLAKLEGRLKELPAGMSDEETLTSLFGAKVKYPTTDATRAVEEKP